MKWIAYQPAACFLAWLHVDPMQEEEEKTHWEIYKLGREENQGSAVFEKHHPTSVDQVEGLSLSSFAKV